MAKNTKYHSRDRAASNALRRKFPDSWLFKPTYDADSHREYAEDWLIEIVDENDDVTGIEFGVQNKTELDVTEKHVSVPMKVEDIKRAVDLQRPFILHAYDTKRRKSWWIWLHDWYAKNYRPEWKDKDIVTVDIPLDQVLTKKTLKDLKAYATWDYRKRKAQKQADLINSTQGDDYYVEVHTEGNQIMMIIHPKHDGAVPVVTPVNEVANQAVNVAVTSGVSMEVPSEGRFSIGNIPSLLQEDSAKIMELAQATIFSYVRDEIFPVKWEFLGKNEELLFSSRVVLMRLIQDGTAVTRWRGSPDDQNVVYDIAAIKKEVGYTIQYSVFLYSNTRKISDLTKYLELIDIVRPIQKFRVTYLSTDEIELWDSSNFFRLTQHEAILRKVVTTLTTVGEHFQIDFDLTGLEMTERNALALERATRVISEGVEPLDTFQYIPEGNNLRVHYPVDAVRKVLAFYDEKGYVDVALQSFSEELKMDVLGHSLILGQAQHIYKNCGIENVDTIRAQLEDVSLSNVAGIEVHYRIDRNNAVRKFLNLPRNSQ